MGRPQRHVDEQVFDAASTSITANGSSENTHDISDALMLGVWIFVTAVSGTTPTLDISIETSSDLKDTADADARFDVQASFTQFTGTGVQSVTINRADDSLGRKIRLKYTVGGTTPDFTIEAKMIAYR